MKKSALIIFSLVAYTSIAFAFLVAGSISFESDLNFSHKFHVVENEVECESCHPDVAESESGKDDLLPKEEHCFECHDKEDSECTMCHKNGDKPELLARITDYSSKFSHKKHIDEGFACTDCHSGIKNKESVSGLHLPNMDKCMACHETPEEIDECRQCHEESENLVPADHTELWKLNHGSFKESGGTECASCHSESYCMDCHLGENLFNESHPPGFILTHAMSYMMKESDCVSCHGGYDYCRECHVDVNYITPVSHANISDWIINQHRIEGKITPDLCITCHTGNEQSCGFCHGK